MEKIIYRENYILRKLYIEKIIYWENYIWRKLYIEKIIYWENYKYTAKVRADSVIHSLYTNTKKLYTIVLKTEESYKLRNY